MIVSHRHKFIFVKTRKTAGTSVQEAVASICGPEDIVTSTSITEGSYQPRHFRGAPTPFLYLRQNPSRHRTSRILYWAGRCTRIHDHMFLDELLALPEAEAWRGYFKFTVERNPWEKVVSRYFWKYRDRPKRPEFDRFIQKDRLNSDFNMYSLDGKLRMDYVCRYETLNDGLAEVSRIIGAKIPPLAHQNVSARGSRDYRELYNDTTREQVARHFAREIALFGYTFDPAPRPGAREPLTS